jgi:cytochrome c5
MAWRLQTRPIVARFRAQFPKTRKGKQPMNRATRLAALAALSGLSAAAAAATDGKAVYEQTCVACHGTGVAGAPKYGDKAAWGPRAAQGKPVLVASVVKGKGAMPPKAGNPALTDEQLQAAVDYLLAAAK